MPEGYRGWANWETWCAFEYCAEAGGYAELAGEGAETLKVYVGQQADECGLPEAGLFTDLVNRGLMAIDWDELAEALAKGK